MRYWMKSRLSDPRKGGLQKTFLHDGGAVVSPFLFAYAPKKYEYTEEVIAYLLSLHENLLYNYYTGLED